MKKKPQRKDPDNYQRKHAQGITRMEEDKRLCTANKKIILEFDKANLIKQTSLPYRIKCLNALRNFGQYTDKSFRQMNKADIKEVWASVLACDLWGEYWKYNMGKTIKTFWKWLKDTDEFPKDIRWLKPKKPTIETIDASKCITIEEVKRMGDSAENPRDKALLKILWESGMRSREIRSLTIGDIERLDESCFLNLDETKTDTPRKVYIFIFYHELLEWLQKHPRQDKPDAPAFPNMLNGHQDNPMIGESLIKVCRVAARRIGLKDKPYNPHWFRHSSISYFYQTNDFTPAELSLKYWGIPNSTQLRRYAHLDAYKTADRIQGNGKAMQHAPRPQTCPTCGQVNDGLTEECVKCHNPLRRGFQLRSDRAMSFFVRHLIEDLGKNPEKAQEFADILKAV